MLSAQRSASGWLVGWTEGQHHSHHYYTLLQPAYNNTYMSLAGGQPLTAPALELLAAMLPPTPSPAAAAPPRPSSCYLLATDTSVGGLEHLASRITQ